MLLFLFYYPVIPKCETLNNTHRVLDSRFSSETFGLSSVQAEAEYIPIYDLVLTFRVKLVLLTSL